MQNVPEEFLPDMQQVPIKFNFTSNICILYLSCNVKMFETAAKLSLSRLSSIMSALIMFLFLTVQFYINQLPSKLQFLTTMYIYCVYPGILKSPKHLSNCLEIIETIVIIIVFNGVIRDVRAYIITIYQVSEMLY